MAALLETSGLTAFYGDAQALFGIDFALTAGEMVAIIGANGAGKSTFMNSVAGLVKTKPEQIRFRGEPIGGLPPGEIVRRGVALVPEGRRLFPSLSVEENLLMGATARRTGPWNLQRLYKLFPILEDKRAHPGTALSGGQQQMVAIGRALMGRPALLLLDEPSVGIAHRLKMEIFGAIKRIQKSGTAILMAEQDAQSALRIADRVYVLEHGHVGREGTSAELAVDDYIRQAYLGVA